MEPTNKEIYQLITDKIREGQELSVLQLRTIFDRLIKLPETYKLEFAGLSLPLIFEKCCVEKRDELIERHYRHYVSIPCLAEAVGVLKKRKGPLSLPLRRLLEHIRNLQLLPGPGPRDREMLEGLLYDTLHLLHEAEVGERPRIDLSSEAARRELAVFFYERMLSSFLSEDEDQLVDESTFVETLRAELLTSTDVQYFASKAAQEHGGDRKRFLVELGGILSKTIQRTYLDNYRGIFNGDREFVQDRFAEAIGHRVQDSDDPRSVDLNSVVTSLLSVTLELIFNNGYSAFRELMAGAILKHSAEKNYG